MKRLYKHMWFGLIVLYFFCCIQCTRDTTVYSIQHDLLRDEHPDLNFYAQRVIRYYKMQNVPDSLFQRVDSLVHAFLDTTNAMTWRTWDNVADSDHYQLDFDLFDLAMWICAAKVCEDQAASRHYLAQSQKIAEKLLTETNNHYWSDWLPVLEKFNKDQALDYLTATLADAESRKYYASLNTIDIAEFYTTISLRYSESFEAPRLQLDNLQRIAVYLFRKYEAMDLSIGCTNAALPVADQSHYTIRSIGLKCNKAIALCENGCIDESIQEFTNVLAEIDLHRGMPYIETYKADPLLKFLYALYQAGNYAEAVQISDTLSRDNLSPANQVKLEIYQGLFASKQNRIDDAEKYYHKAIQKAKDINEKEYVVTSLINLADLKIDLNEFDRALVYSDSACGYLESNSIETLRQKTNIQSNYVEIYASLGNSAEFNKSLDTLLKLLEEIENPYRKAVNLQNLGRLYFETNDITQAEKYFQKSIQTFERLGLQRHYLETLIAWSTCLLETDEANGIESLLKTIKKQCFRQDDAYSIIEYYGLAAELSYKKHHLTEAIEYSHKLWQAVKNAQANVESSSNIELFNQRVYRHLKNAVRYEIENKNKNAAFLKLEDAKAWSLKKDALGQNVFGYSSMEHEKTVEHFLKTIPANVLLIDYMVLDDGVFAFCLDANSIEIVQIDVKGNELEKLCSALESMLEESKNILAQGETNDIDQNFAQCSTTLTRISDNVLNPQICDLLENYDTIYFIPDDFLWRLPFCSLILKKNNDKTFLVEAKSTICAPSAMLAASILQDSAPEFDVSKKSIMFCVDHQYPESQRVQNYISTHFQNSTYLSFNSSTFDKKELINQISSKAHIFIFFGHCQSNTVSPLSSFLRASIFCTADSSYHETLLSLQDFEHVAWHNTEMVILMGCGTARGKLIKGTGMGGMQHGLQVFGVPKVLATLWEIDAYTASVQLERILQSLIDHNTLEEALRKSQIELINDLMHSTEQIPHPLLWAGYRISQTRTFIREEL